MAAEIDRKRLHEGRRCVIDMLKNQRGFCKVVKLFRENDTDSAKEIYVHSALAAQCPGVVAILPTEGTATKQLEMAYCEHGSMRVYLRERRGVHFDEGTLLRMYMSMIDTLSSVHERRYVHRLINSGNWLVTREEEIKLSDFGAAMLIEGSDSVGVHQVVNSVGTVIKVSNRIFGEDVWFLAKVFFEMVTLEPSISMESQAVVERVCAEANYSTLISTIITRMQQLGARMRQQEVASLLGCMRNIAAEGHFETITDELFSKPAIFKLCSICITEESKKNSLLTLACSHLMCAYCVHKNAKFNQVICVLCDQPFDLNVSLSHSEMDEDTQKSFIAIATAPGNLLLK